MSGKDVYQGAWRMRVCKLCGVSFYLNWDRPVCATCLGD